MTTDEAAADEVHAVLAKFQTTIGPWMVDDDGEPREHEPIPGAMLAEWIVVMSWVDPADGKHYTTRLPSPGLPSHHEGGLLHEALYDF